VRGAYGRTGEFAVPEVSGVVLAGGQSRRLSQDKSLLQIDGRWILESVVQKLSSLTQDLLIVAANGDKLDRLGARVVPDVQTGRGPLVGILTGLEAMRHSRGVFVACDMPLLNLGLLRYMILVSEGHDVVMPRIGEYIEPLHAVYHRSCLPHIVDALDRGQHRPASFLGQVCVRYVEQREIETFDPRHLSFFNINTPDDLREATCLLRGDSC
jgi:molybdopterin-guanine dinucleotide biosynthesis protein A